MTTLYVANDHSALLHLWRRTNQRGLRLLRFDAHCDLRGLVVDEVCGRAAARLDPRLLEGGVDGGNFLSHAVLERRVQSIRWVHGPHGGRDRDLGTVAFATDLPQSLISRWRHGWVPLRFRGMASLDPKQSIAPGEELDLDFDYFASRLAPRASIDTAIEDFFGRNWDTAPDVIYFACSPDYCHAVPETLAGFIARLETFFAASRIQLPEPPRAPRPGWLERLSYRADRVLRQLGAVR